ncbi:redoxin domain-containing protein [Agaribacterium haliotis]|uniref:redoxin domain-containing protein n=1 Tax=Agaribacterium haliotis TaxID=2013869 RepID=UPI000BB5619B|nr:redoxin domain-containing protein [Agaribacterium haliotis]
MKIHQHAYRLFTALLLLALGANSLAAAKINEAAPEFELTDSNSNTVNLSQFKGSTVILEWTNNECPFVKKHYDSGNMQKLQKHYRQQGVVWLSIISSAPGKQGYVDNKTANELTASRDAEPSHVLFDPSGEVGKLYGAKTTPQIAIIDKQGILRYNGAIDSIPSANPADIAKAQNYVDSAMAALDKGQLPKPAITRPYGCSVKYK